MIPCILKLADKEEGPHGCDARIYNIQRHIHQQHIFHRHLGDITRVQCFHRSWHVGTVFGLLSQLFATTIFIGPLLASTIGIIGAAALIIDALFMNETFPPVFLIEKANELRQRTKNWGIYVIQEKIEIALGELLRKNFSRALMFLFTEPIVLCLNIYIEFLYGLLYLFLTAYPIVFQRIHGFEKGVSGLPYLGLIIGEFIGGLVLTGSWLFSIFLQALNYIVDAYLLLSRLKVASTSAASALAANSILRSSAGAGFPLFVTYMFNGPGVNWAGTLLGCVAAALIPIPISLYLYGDLIRAKSKFATQTM
ncbi:hypothetical protein PENARI_c017G07079 [Penicillium arizonense]|uniref:Major facilitator superfamily (MFS) profile domain-containing protein n=1 Tax=Penicillium arizonense TaxID=1835702 RepID=A0A1F5LAS5_PENAI|nr:hypothetical protein PENARI_c017G07079 [Penicillium arizonense]OGE50302.1 hypothetical protein PENARI_c017G07079 [Penicillium arizonense]